MVTECLEEVEDAESRMSAEVKESRELQIAHILFIDIVGYSKLLSDKQRELFEVLNELVRSSAQFRSADAGGKLLRLPTGDGMVLAFFTSVDAPVRCAQEIGRKVREYPQLLIRMGINSGPVDEVRDMDNRRNVTGAGVNLAQRVMDCGDARAPVHACRSDADSRWRQKRRGARRTFP